MPNLKVQLLSASWEGRAMGGACGFGHSIVGSAFYAGLADLS